MNTRRRRNLRRTDLFLVRVWTEGATTLIDARGLEDAAKSTDASGHGDWSGSVQRVVDGEARQFKGWQSLVDTLAAMLAETRDKLDR